MRIYHVQFNASMEIMLCILAEGINGKGHIFQGRFKAMLVEKETYLLELSGVKPCRTKISINTLEEHVCKEFE